MAVVDFERANYFTISEGRICQAHKTPVEKSISRTSKTGKLVHETFHNGLKGRIVDIAIKEHQEYGKFWLVTLEDENRQRDVLQMRYSSGYSQSFLKTLPNVDLTSEVILAPKLSIKENGKKRGTLFVMQHGFALKWFYTMDDPNGLPDLVKKKLKGKEIWDDTEIMEFLEAMVKEDILPRLKEIGNRPVEKLEVVDTDAAEEDKEELPF